MPDAKKSPLAPWMLLPGTLLWVVIGIGLCVGDSRLVGGAIAVAVLAIVAGLVRRGLKHGQQSARRKAVWTSGRPARARIDAVRTQGHFNDHPRVEFSLTVQPTTGEAYGIANVTVISQLAVPRIQPNMEVEVRIDPDDPSFVVLDESLTPYGYA